MKFKKMFPTSFYINLDNRPDRRTNAVHEFRKMGLRPERFSGVVGNWVNNSWWNGAIACMLSHIECLRAGLERKTNVFIF